MNKLFSILLVLVATLSYGQKNMGIGLKGGSLNGITFKKYSNVSDIEINLGTTYTPYAINYKQYFNTVWIEKNSYILSDYDYRGHVIYQPVALQVRLLFHKNLNKIGDENITGLQWYYGIGGQLGSRTIDFIYRYKGGPDLIARHRDIDLGADGIIGLEYTFDQVPIALFLDVNLFMELADDPFFFWFQGGLGARYRF
ncbi:MAG: hypothetical protein OEY51_11645 [Cyclobacteriaceae bacterium]|nr:hypothetical protein [Cyclobacteriaceae bacterium]